MQPVSSRRLRPPLNRDPKLERNQLVALVLCMAVLLVYPWILKRFAPVTSAPVPVAAQGSSVIEEKAESVVPEAVIAADVVSLERPSEPRVIHFENDLYDAELTSVGGSIMKLAYRGDPGMRERTKTVFLSAEPDQPGLFAVRLANETADLTRAVFQIEQPTEDSVRFVYEKAGEYRFIKRLFFGRSEPIVNMELTLENLSSVEKQFPPEIFLGMRSDATKSAAPHEFQAVAWTEKVVAADGSKIHKKGFSLSEKIEWAGLLKKYFCILVKPESRAIGLSASEEQGTIWAKLQLEPVSVPAGQSRTLQHFVYAGPQRYEALRRYDVGFDNVLSRGFFGGFKILLLRALKFSHQHTHNFGWDILLITLLIKLLFAPLTHMSYQSMAKMKAVQPKVQSIQERYKNDPAKMNREMMELYKKHRVNPMGGCLPMVLQIPVFIAFYQMLSEAIELKGAPFIGWIHDLAEPDRLFQFHFSLPVVGDSFNLLPLLMMASMVIQQRMTPQPASTPEQQKIFAFMPLMFGFIFYNMPSGLVLYWLLNNVLTILQQGLVKPVVGALHHEDDKA